MVIVGAVFIILRLKEKVNLDAGQGESWKVSLLTSSPGVAFGVVGAILISIASLSKDTITISDSGLYLTKEYLVAPYFSAEGSRSALEKYLIEQGKDGSEKVKEQHPPKGESTNSDKTSDKKTKKSEGNDDEELMITFPPTKK